MTRRYMPALSLALLAAGVTTGLLGILGNNTDVSGAGLFLTLVAVPLVIARIIRGAQTVTADQLAEADRAGYQRALDHVARGLLDQHTAPTPGGRVTPEQTAGNVIHIYPYPPATYREERKAQ
ncbi:hypothetical protein ACWGJ2_04425 [Streptomyces sp. NPDC054796]